MNILGLNAFHGDSAAALLVDGELRAAVEEERFRRIKHWAGFPSQSIAYCLQSQGLNLRDIDIIAINTDPAAARWKKINFALSGRASMALVKEKLRTRKKRNNLHDYLRDEFPEDGFEGTIEYVEHHLSHLASAYCVSPFEQASVVSVDGFGDFASGAWGYGKGGEIDLQKRIYFPHSLGIFYQAMTQSLGFPHYGDEYKVMGLAPYGEPRYRAQMDQVLSTNEQGEYRLNLDYFLHHRQPIGFQWDNGSPLVSRLYSPHLESLIGAIRKPDEPLQQHHHDLARSIQDAYERAFFKMLGIIHTQHGCENLAIAGGCGMNSVANGKVHLRTPYRSVYIQSAAGDAGGAIGAALIAHQRQDIAAPRFRMQHAFWGASFTDDELGDMLRSNQVALEKAGCRVEYAQPLEQLFDQVADYITQGHVIGWFQGAMEWGPRALGNRSILGDPRRNDMKDILNLKIKRRESFRPFAPSILRDQVRNWFESDADVPFMMKVFKIKVEQREKIPAVTHVDGSGRLQTVSREHNQRYYDLIKQFFAKTGVPMLLNTSFNENEPVVCMPQEALDCFLRTNMDVLVLGNHVVTRLVDRKADRTTQDRTNE